MGHRAGSCLRRCNVETLARVRRCTSPWTCAVCCSPRFTRLAGGQSGQRSLQCRRGHAEPATGSNETERAGTASNGRVATRESACTRRHVCAHWLRLHSLQAAAAAALCIATFQLISASLMPWVAGGWCVVAATISLLSGDAEMGTGHAIAGLQYSLALGALHSLREDDVSARVHPRAS